MKTFKEEAAEWLKNKELHTSTELEQYEVKGELAEKIEKAKENFAKIGFPKPELLEKLSL